MAYIEPCCIDQQLPSLIGESKRGFAFFHTSGDVTLKRMLEGVSWLPDRASHVMVLTVAATDVAMLRTIADYFRRGWTLALLLLTQENQRTLVEQELAPYISRVHYAADPLVVDHQLVIVGRQRALVLQGAVLGSLEFSLCQYAVWLGGDAAVVRQALDPAIAKMKSKALIDHHDQTDVARVLDRTFWKEV